MLDTRERSGDSPSHAGLPEALAHDPRLADDVEALDHALARVSSLTLTAREMLEVPYDARRARELRAVDDALARASGLVVLARQVVEGIDVRRREALLLRIALTGALVAGLVLAIYVLTVDELRNMGLLVAALGLIFLGRVVRSRRWRS